MEETSRTPALLRRVQVSIPFRMFIEDHAESFLSRGLNPEIGFDAEALDAFDPSLHQSVLDRFHRAGRTITLHAPFVDLSPGSPDPWVRDLTSRRFQQLLNWLPAARPVSVVAHTGYDFTRYGPAEGRWLSSSVAFWRSLADSLSHAGIRLMLENVYERGPNDIRPLIEALAHPNIGFCLDVGHQAAFGQDSLLDWAQHMAPFIRQLHLHDNNGRADQHLAIGAGHIDFSGLFERLGSLLSVPPLITLEPHREGDLEPSLEALARLWPWAR